MKPDEALRLGIMFVPRRSVGKLTSGNTELEVSVEEGRSVEGVKENPLCLFYGSLSLIVVVCAHY